MKNQSLIELPIHSKLFSPDLCWRRSCHLCFKAVIEARHPIRFGTDGVRDSPFSTPTYLGLLNLPVLEISPSTISHAKTLQDLDKTCRIYMVDGEKKIVSFTVLYRITASFHQLCSHVITIGMIHFDQAVVRQLQSAYDWFDVRRKWFKELR